MELQSGYIPDLALISVPANHDTMKNAVLDAETDLSANGTGKNSAGADVNPDFMRDLCGIRKQKRFVDVLFAVGHFE
ncbi:hypothetical protein L0244_12585 [bacterium]|nr:hypothetical protein [bacterium]